MTQEKDELLAAHKSKLNHQDSLIKQLEHEKQKFKKEFESSSKQNKKDLSLIDDLRAESESILQQVNELTSEIKARNKQIKSLNEQLSAQMVINS